MEHYRNPRNFGELTKFTHRGEEANSLCGDRVEFFLDIRNGLVNSVKWKGEGCAICMAGASMWSEEIGGIKLDDLKDLVKRTGKGVVEMFGMEGINPVRMRCALLGWECVRNLV